MTDPIDTDAVRKRSADLYGRVAPTASVTISFLCDQLDACRAECERLRAGYEQIGWTREGEYGPVMHGLRDHARLLADAEDGEREYLESFRPVYEPRHQARRARELLAVKREVRRTGILSAD